MPQKTHDDLQWGKLSCVFLWEKIQDSRSVGKWQRKERE